MTKKMHEKAYNPDDLDVLNKPERLADTPPELLVEHANLKNPSLIIDWGAGTGLFSKAIAKEFTNSKIYALDINQRMIDWMNENLIGDYPNIIPLLIADDKVPLDDNTADFIFTVRVHHEFDDPEKALAECFRLLKSGARLAISDWKKIHTEHGPPLEERYETAEVEKQLISVGFKVNNIFTHLPNNYLIIAEKPE